MYNKLYNSLCLQVTSHEIAASTAQLVAASRVKADKDSHNFIKVIQESITQCRMPY